ncbi:hypothetical protein TMatcc_005550 [Talaromyces marneffei ATCC 18224]|uniref:Uncharacterized protein n=1 Tax=Talaromyces marneffei (strain ATCC 18224 / CBS 334.59 / QM 7333) TaxID=441960 RepID=B6QA33_TALMQ|nr:hypothetical protein PMAA_072750 [Talaromyces marneffei ATCC 18224]
MSSSNQTNSTTATSSSHFSLTTWGHLQVTRSSSSKSGRIPISETAAYSWLRVQKIMELSVQHQPESECLDNPTFADSNVNALTRINSSASSSASSVATNDSNNAMQEMDKHTVLIGRTDPLTHGKSVPSITILGDGVEK